MNSSTDRIERQILLKAPRSRVWRALAFDRIPPARREEAFRMNSGGWDRQMKHIETYVAAH